MAKKLICILIAAAMVLTIFPAISLNAHAYTQFRDSQELSGATYSVDYAQKLDDIFSGKAQLFSNTTDGFALGEWLNNRKVYQVAGVMSGYQCYIYAQSVYYYLFGDIPYTGNGLVYWSNSSKIMENQSEASFESFKAANVGFGAYVRTTTSWDGSFNGSGGHSFIVLSYDEEGITYLEGNADGYGLVCVTSRSWQEFNKNQLGGRNRKICHIVQSNDSSYCTHEGYTDLGDCQGCKQPFNWGDTFCTEAAGLYRATAEISLRMDSPYTQAESCGVLEAGEVVEILGTCENAAGEQWYQILYHGQNYFVPVESLEYDSAAPLRVSCNDFSPSHRAVLERKSQPVMGTVVSNYPLSAIYGYLNGELFATWYAWDDCTTEVNLRYTDVNNCLVFASLADGKYTIELEAYSFEREDGVLFHSSSFYMNVEPSEETYTVSFDANGGQNAPEGFTKYADEDVSLTQAMPIRAGYIFLGWATDPQATQPEYGCGDKFTANANTTLYALWKPQGITLRGTVTSFLTAGEVTLTLMQGRNTVATLTVHEQVAAYTMEGLAAGNYTLVVEKANHASRSYDLTISGSDLNQDLQICPVGDITGDGAVNIKDYQRLLRHVNKSTDLEGYALVCADVTNDGSCNIKDYQRLLRHVNRSSLLF